MPTDPDGHSTRWYQQLPPKVAAVVVFLVALTTLLGNLFELNEKRDAPAAAPTVPVTITEPPQPTTPVSQTAPESRRYRLQVERIVVENDGSPGTTDWRFTVLADGEPLFAFRHDDLDDTAGRNVAIPADAAGSVRLKPGQRLAVSVHGWRLSRLHSAERAPDAAGQGELNAESTSVPIRIEAETPEQGAFNIHIGLDPERQAE